MVEVEMTMSAISAPIWALPSSIMPTSVSLLSAKVVRDFAGALDQRLVDLAGAGLERGIELLRAGVERLGAGLEFADQRLAALGQRPLDAVRLALEFGVERARGAAEQRHHAGGALVEQVGQRPGQVVGGVASAWRCACRAGWRRLRPRSTGGR